jgi:hypothetical protein
MKLPVPTLIKWATPTEFTRRVTDPAVFGITNKAVDRAASSNWGLTIEEQAFVALAAAYATAELSMDRMETELLELSKERDSLRMQLGRSKKQVEKLKGADNESDTAAE